MDDDGMDGTSALFFRDEVPPPPASSLPPPDFLFLEDLLGVLVGDEGWEDPSGRGVL